MAEQGIRHGSGDLLPHTRKSFVQRCGINNAEHNLCPTMWDKKIKAEQGTAGRLAWQHFGDVTIVASAQFERLQRQGCPRGCLEQRVRPRCTRTIAN